MGLIAKRQTKQRMQSRHFHSVLDLEALTDCFQAAADEIPEKRSMLIKNGSRPFFTDDPLTPTVAYGYVAPSKKTGKIYVSLPSWTVALSKTDVGFATTLIQVRTMNDTIGSWKEYKLFHNAFLERVTQADPSAVDAPS